MGMNRFKFAAPIVMLIAAISPANSQVVKDIRTTKGKAVALTNLVALRPDCSIGLMDIPAVVKKPAHGELQQAITTANLPAHQNCPAKPGSVIAVVYVPSSDYVGSDAASFQVTIGGQTQTYAYNIVVESN